MSAEGKGEEEPKKWEWETQMDATPIEHGDLVHDGKVVGKVINFHMTLLPDFGVGKLARWIRVRESLRNRLN